MKRQEVDSERFRFLDSKLPSWSEVVKLSITHPWSSDGKTRPPIDKGSDLELLCSESGSHPKEFSVGPTTISSHLIDPSTKFNKLEKSLDPVTSDSVSDEKGVSKSREKLTFLFFLRPTVKGDFSILL